MIIFIFIAIIALAFVGLRALEPSSSKNHTNSGKKSSVYDLSGKNYLL